MSYILLLLINKTHSYNLVLFYFLLLFFFLQNPKKVQLLDAQLPYCKNRGQHLGWRREQQWTEIEVHFFSMLEVDKRKIQNLYLGVQISIYYFSFKMLAALIMRLMWIYKITPLLWVFDVIMTAVWWCTWYPRQIKLRYTKAF